MIRSFLAVQLPPVVVQYLERVSAQLQGLGLHGRFVRPESVHLTLKFLGDIEKSRVEQLAEQVEQCCSGFESFELKAGGVGVFPHLKRPRVVWVGLGTSRELSQLQRCIDSRLDREGFPSDKRPFHPHLTLLRLKSQRNVPELTRFISLAPQEEMKFQVEEVHLWRSLLRPDGARYVKLATSRLKMKE